MFAVPQNLTEQLRKDAAYARVPLVDDQGRRLDFHALRATCATLMARAGVPLQMARRLMRHVDPKLTARHYEKLAMSDLRVGSQQLGDAFWRDGLAAAVAASATPDAAQPGTTRHNAENDRRTGTDGAAGT